MINWGSVISAIAAHVVNDDILVEFCVSLNAKKDGPIDKSLGDLDVSAMRLICSGDVFTALVWKMLNAGRHMGIEYGCPLGVSVVEVLGVQKKGKGF